MIGAASEVNDTQGFDKIRTWLKSRCAIVYPEHKAPLLRQRLSRVVYDLGYANLNELALALIDENSEQVQLAVMHAASTNHTYFFREQDVLDSFRDVVLDALKDKPDIRIWSAAASTGDEAYTIAMIIAEALGSDALKRTHILGTDLSAPVIDQAEEGIYSTRQFDKTKPEILRRYFDATGDETYRVKDNIRSVCTFRRMNLKATPYPFSKPFQAVFCRNILYYFERADQLATLEAIYDATEPGGWLVTSVTEPIRDLGSRWEPVCSGIFRRSE